jgi:hypothetical protein
LPSNNAMPFCFCVVVVFAMMSTIL